MTAKTAAHAGGPTRGRELAAEAAAAAEVRAYHNDPDVVALRVDRVRAQVDRLCWAGIVLALAFTMTNVQAFAAAGAAPWTSRWLTAWFLDPMVSLVLLAILRAEQVTARYQVRTGRWVRTAKWLTLSATSVMNTWESYAAASPSAIVVHSVRPLRVLAAAEAVTDLREKLTEAAILAVNGTAGHRQHADDPQPRLGRPMSRPQARPTRRKYFDDYLAEAHQAWRPGVEVTRPGCAR